MLSRLSILTVPLAATALLAACSQGSDATVGQYRLVRTQHGQLPAYLGEEKGCRHDAVRGSVELMEDGKYRATMRRRRDCADPTAPDSRALRDTTFEDVGEGRYEVEGDSVYFRFADGAAAGFGAFRGDTLVVQGPEHTLYYRRQEPR